MKLLEAPDKIIVYTSKSWFLRKGKRHTTRKTLELAFKEPSSFMLTDDELKTKEVSLGWGPRRVLVGRVP